ncbi:HET-domain-containing protein [Paramyrothecium foliicola]|nr:HET-domain-containing protein [Paramyrothecium foliicola]
MNGIGQIVGASIYAPLQDFPESVEGEAPSPKSWGIRCLALEPGKGNEPLKCELVQSHLGEIGGTYEALSYTWGDPTVMCSVTLGGHPFNITKNLESALHHLRRPNNSRRLWIDALCINQADVSEVNKYVRRMWAVYENARNVVVFLGASRDNCDQALHLLFELSCLSSEVGVRHSQIQNLLRDDRRSAHWKALRQLMRRPWWDRAWIIQEYAVAHRVTFLCGQARLAGDDFNQAMEYLLDFRYNATVSQSCLPLVTQIASTPVSHLLTIRRHYQLPKRVLYAGPLDVLYRSRGFKASDPRDKVFSLFRLIGEDPLLQPNYSHSARDLFKDVVKAIISFSGTLEILCHHNRGTSGALDLPSWCPDWTMMHGKRFLLCTKKYTAAGNFPAEIHIEGDVMSIKGKSLDSIEWLSKPFQQSDFSNSKALHTKLMKLKRQVLKMAVSPSRDYAETSEAFQQTAVSSRVLERGPNGWKPRVLDPSAVQEMWNAWSLSLQQPKSPDDNVRGLTKTLRDALRAALYGRSLFISKEGNLGLVDSTAQIGDVVVVALGGEVLFALHNTSYESQMSSFSSEHSTFNLVGECYMHGFMAGEGLAGIADTDQLDNFDLV